MRKKASKDARKEILRTLVNPRERRIIEDACQKREVSVSEWLREHALAAAGAGGKS